MHYIACRFVVCLVAAIGLGCGPFGTAVFGAGPSGELEHDNSDLPFVPSLNRNYVHTVA